MWEQIQLAKAQKEGGTFTVKKFKTVKDITGARKTIEHEKRIRQWWFVAADGKVCLNIRYGAKIIEFAKGKTAVELASAKELVATLETISAAVNAGELDAAMEAASTKLRSAFTK